MARLCDRRLARGGDIRGSQPLYRIEKRPKLARKQGAFSVVAATGLVLKRGHDLAQVLKVFEKRALRLIDA